MKNKLLFIIPVCIFLLAGIGILLYPKKSVEPVLCQVAVPEFPVMQNPSLPAEDTPYQVLPESEGRLADYTIHDDVIYYMVGYPFDVGVTGYRHMAVFKQALAGGELEKVTDYESDKCMEVTELYFDEQLGWIGCVDDYELWQYTLYDDHIEEVSYEDEEPPSVEEVIKGYNVDADTLDGVTWVRHENETYVVWMKCPYLGDSITTIGSTTNILNKTTGEVTVIENSEYCEGALDGQVLYGDYLFFHVYDDEKAHINEEDYFENNYMFDLKTRKEKRITTNQGTVGQTDSVLYYDTPKIYEKGICFMAQSAEETEGDGTHANRYMYYMELE